MDKKINWTQVGIFASFRSYFQPLPTFISHYLASPFTPPPPHRAPLPLFSPVQNSEGFVSCNHEARLAWFFGSPKISEPNSKADLSLDKSAWCKEIKPSEFLLSLGLKK